MPLALLEPLKFSRSGPFIYLDFYFLYLYKTYAYSTFFDYSSDNVYLGWSHIFVIINSDVVNINVQALLVCWLSILWVSLPRSGTAGSSSGSISMVVYTEHPISNHKTPYSLHLLLHLVMELFSFAEEISKWVAFTILHSSFPAFTTLHSPFPAFTTLHSSFPVFWGFKTRTLSTLQNSVQRRQQSRKNSTVE